MIRSKYQPFAKRGSSVFDDGSESKKRKYIFQFRKKYQKKTFRKISLRNGIGIQQSRFEQNESAY